MKWVIAKTNAFISYGINQGDAVHAIVHTGYCVDMGFLTVNKIPYKNI